MKRKLLTLWAFALSAIAFGAVSPNTVEVKFNGTTATVSVASNISAYVTVSSGSSSHVKILQAENFAGVDKNADNEDGEIIYVLSGTSADGEFYMEGAFKCQVELDNLTLTNPSGPAINIQNGKRIKVTAKKNTTNTIVDGANEDFNGCLHCKGHTEFKGKGTLNVTGNSKHAVYSKEYIELKNITLNIKSAVKDAIHCKEYFLMESGTVNISSAGDDGIQVELANDPVTGVIADHEDENSANFYMLDGTLTISNYTDKALKVDGETRFTGGKRNFNEADILIHAGIASHSLDAATNYRYYDLQGRRVAPSALKKGLYIVNGKKVVRK